MLSRRIANSRIRISASPHQDGSAIDNEIACANQPTPADLLLPQLPEALAAIAATVRAQQFALALTLVRGRNPDAPGGLSKVTLTH